MFAELSTLEVGNHKIALPTRKSRGETLKLIKLMWAASEHQWARVVSENEDIITLQVLQPFKWVWRWSIDGTNNMFAIELATELIKDGFGQIQTDFTSANCPGVRAKLSNSGVGLRLVDGVYCLMSNTSDGPNVSQLLSAALANIEDKPAEITCRPDEVSYIRARISTLSKNKGVSVSTSYENGVLKIFKRENQLPAYIKGAIERALLNGITAEDIREYLDSITSDKF